jgi:hypothetical protein
MDDITYYDNCCKKLRNLIPLPRGVGKRKGVIFSVYKGCSCGKERIYGYRGTLMYACPCRPPMIFENGKWRQL